MDSEHGERFRSVPTPPSVASPVRVSDILSLPGFAGSIVIAGKAGLARRVDRVNVIQIPTDRFIKRNELVMTAGRTFRNYRGDLPQLIRSMRDRRISALAIRSQGLQRLLGSAVRLVAEQGSLPIIELPKTSHLSELQTHVLEAIVQGRTHQLEVAESIRDQLADHVLRGGGLDAVPLAIGQITGGEVILVGRDGDVLATSADGHRTRPVRIAGSYLARRGIHPSRTEDGWIVWPVLAGKRRIGCLIAYIPGEYEAIHHAALQHGATNAALQILHRDDAVETDARLKAGFVLDLLTGSLVSVSAMRRAKAIGWNPRGTFRALVIGLEKGQPAMLVGKLRTLAPDALVTDRTDVCLVILPIDGSAESGPGGRVREDRSDRFAAQTLNDQLDVHVGVSALHASIQDLPAAVAEAQEALQTARKFDRSSRIWRFEELGILQLLSEVAPSELRSFQSTLLRPLEELDTSNRQTLLETLQLLIDCDLNVAEAARRGGWHYNTVRNRVARLRELVGPFTQNGNVLDAVRVALMIRRHLRR